MRIAVIGTGYVGLVSGACFSEFGVDVVCVDKDQGKIARLEAGEMPIYEPGLEDLVARNTASGRLTFTTGLADAVNGADAVFIAVGTPTSRRGDGYADLSYVYAAAEEVARALTRPTVLITKSTVPVGTGRRLKQLVAEVRPDLTIEVASNPEFLREGSAIDDFMRPDRVVIGVDSQAASDVLRALYRPLYLMETPIVETAIETAEIIKYAANSFLAVKITFINQIADLCERIGADVQDVARAIGLDGRIGSKFLHAGPGYGGSCFPKDTLAFARAAEELGAPQRIVETVIDVNEARKRSLATRVLQAMGGDIRGRRIGVLGLTFKPNTDDMRDSPSLAIIPRLQEEGAEVHAHDPAGMKEAAKLLPGVVFEEDIYEVARGADCLVIVTEWNAFRALDPRRLKDLMRRPLIVDLRNVYPRRDMEAAGFDYLSIGRPAVRAAERHTAHREIA